MSDAISPENHEVEDHQVEEQPIEADETASAKPADDIKALELEGDVAADYIEELLDIYDLDGDIDIDVRQGRAYIEVTGAQDSNVRLLSDPETVDALQELARLAVQTKTGQYSRLILDIAGSRNAKVSALGRMVERAIAKAQETQKDVPLKPMSSYERKLAHDLIAEAGLVSESEGEGKDRHIVIKLG
jgi:spoIIIJ-associated protein